MFSDSDSDSELSLSLIDARVDSLDDSPQFMGADIPETVSEKTVSKTSNQEEFQHQTALYKAHKSVIDKSSQRGKSRKKKST